MQRGLQIPSGSLSAATQRKPTTIQDYRIILRKHLVPFFGRIKLRDLSPPHVRAFKARKIEAGLNPFQIAALLIGVPLATRYAGTNPALLMSSALGPSGWVIACSRRSRHSPASSAKKSAVP